MSERKATVTRNTAETQISITVNLDGTGKADISTGIGFFDHMLLEVAKHGFFDLEIRVKGDLEVDDHHTVEDTGIALGQAFAQALGGKEGIRRYGSAMIPMDECLALCALDLSGRPCLVFDADIPSETLGSMHSEMVREFFYAFSYSCPMNLHLKLLYGMNSHHIAEVLFKAFARAMDAAVSTDPRIEGVLSTKGKL